MEESFTEIPMMESFRFGDTVCQALHYKEIPIRFGGLNEKIKVAIVDTNIPLLISLNNLEKWKAVIDFSERTLKVKTVGITERLKRTNSNHLAIAMSKNTADDKEEFVTRVYEVWKEGKFQFKWLKKIHRIFGRLSLGTNKLGKQ